MNLNISRIEQLTKENYDTWKIQVEALLTRNDVWQYVNGDYVKPEAIAGNVASINEQEKWIKEDKKAKSELILSMSPSELRQLKGCDTSRSVWLKLQSIFESKGPARKATLLKRLIHHKLMDNGDVRQHIEKFFETVDKLEEMEIKIHEDLLSILLLYSLPDIFENFRCAIESRDQLPKVETLKIKILEEYDARIDKMEPQDGTNALIATMKGAKYKSKNFNMEKNNKYQEQKSGNHNKYYNKNKNDIICFRCHKKGHIAAKCYSKMSNNKPEKDENRANLANDVFCVMSANNCEKENIKIERHDQRWCLDSGSTAHLCNNINLFEEIKPIDENLNLATKNSACVTGKGKITMKIVDENINKDISLENALLVPDLRTNLMSVSKIVNKGYTVKFNEKIACVRDKQGKIKLIADRIGDLFYVRQPIEHANKISENNNSLKIWHERLGHLNEKDLKTMLNHQKIENIKHEELPNCEVCIMGKQIRNPFHHEHERAKNKLEIIHSDICGPFRTTSMGGARYFCTFIDDNTRYCTVYVIKSKDEVFNKFKIYKNMVETICKGKIKYLQTDNGKEYCNTRFDEYLNESGIQRRLTTPYTPQQNGVAERRNRTLLEMARCMIISAECDRTLWGEAIMMANYIRNRCPTKSLKGKIPYELWFNKRVNINHMKVFGCKAYVLDKTVKRSKLDNRSHEGILTGYSDECKGYRVYIPTLRKVIISRDVVFIENTDKLKVNNENSHNKNDNKVPEIEVYNEWDRTHDSEENENNLMNIEVRRLPGRPKIVRTGCRGRPRRLFRSVEENIEHIPTDESSDDDCVFGDAIANYAEVTLSEAMLSENKTEWLDAISNEFESLIKNDTWKIIEKPKDKNIVDNRIVLTNKVNSNGKIYRRKARLVARGFSQIKGYDFDKTFAPVARIDSLRLLMAIAAEYNLIVHQLDVTCAFLNGKLDEEIYMAIPECLQDCLKRMSEKNKCEIQLKAKKMLKQIENKINICCKLNKALYGLKQASRQWNIVLNEKLEKLGLKATVSDPCIYYLKNEKQFILVLVYVDDLLIAGNEISKIEEIKNGLKREFEIKDMGKANYCLGIEIIRSHNEITLIQRKYIREALEKFEMKNANGVSVPGIANKKFELCNSSYDEKVPYRELIGTLMYLAVVSRPDILNRVVNLAQFVTGFKREHWIAAKRILRYLKQTIDLGLKYKKGSFNLIGFTDADWGADINDRKSYTGYAFILSGAAISWSSRKQRTVAMSSAEAEYMAIAEAAKEAIYLKKILNEIGIKLEIKLYNDNQSANTLTQSSTFHNRVKHIDLRYHFVKDAIKNNEFILKHLPGDDMIADILTKALNHKKHMLCCQGLGLEVISDIK